MLIIWQSVHMRYMLCIIAVSLATPANAEPLMSGIEFDEYTRGKTLFYGQNGQTYGAEQYLNNRRVRWSFLDGECKEGLWYEQEGMICFIYEDRPDPQCWTFSLNASGITARFENEDDTTELYEAGDLDEEMVCLGPKVGV